MHVIVNGRSKEMLSRLYFDQLVRAAFGGVYVDDAKYTVTYEGAKSGKGKLLPQESIATEDGMTFEVAEVGAG